MQCSSINRFLIKAPLVIGFSSLFFLSSAQALPLRIVDCRGKTRALNEATSEEPSDVSVHVESQPGVAQNTHVTLVSSSGEEVSATVEDGIAQFHNLAPGTWVMSADGPGLYFSEITLGKIPFFFTPLGEGSLIVAGSVTGVLVGDKIANSGSSGGSSGNGGSGGGGGAGAPCVACDPNANAPSVGTFSIRR